MNYCLVCGEEFKKLKDLNYTCKCDKNHAICFECSKDMRFDDVQELFGEGHTARAKEYHPEDIKTWNEDVLNLARADKEFEENFVNTNLVKYGNISALNIEKIFESYKGEHHDNINFGNEYGFSYEPQKVNIRWFTTETGNPVTRNFSVIHQIKVYTTTNLSIVSNGTVINVGTVKANKPFTLNLPIQSIPYDEVTLVFSPNIKEYKYTVIDIWSQSGAGDPLYKHMIGKHLTVPSRGYAVVYGRLTPLEELEPKPLRENLYSREEISSPEIEKMEKIEKTKKKKMGKNTNSDLKDYFKGASLGVGLVVVYRLFNMVFNK